MTTARMRLGPLGEQVRGNVVRMRKGRHLTYAALSERTAAAGRPLAIIALRRIEAGLRRVDVDDLVTLAAALGVEVGAIMAADLCEICDGVVPNRFVCDGCGGIGRP